MQCSFEHQSPQFAISSQFESFSALKHACTRTALLNVYEFVPDKVDTDRYTLLNKVLQSIRIIKFFAWEARFNAIINDARREELK